MPGKRVAIIGAGVAGLVSIKSCLEEHLEPVCFERHDDLGGTWYYTEELRKGQGAAVYDSMISNFSKEMLCFSDFPFPKEWPPFLPREKMNQYLHSYVEHFSLKKHILFNTDVLAIEREGNDGWKVVTKRDDREIDEMFDYIMVCTGVYSKIHYPSYPGLEEFNGIQIHSNEYRDASRFKGKRVVVVGAAHTAGEIACELARNGSSQVFLSMRHGTWVFSRLMDTTPFDMKTFSRSTMTGSTGAIATALHSIANHHIKDYSALGLQSSEPILGTKSFMINDDIQYRIMQGKLKPVSGIETFGKNNITLKDGMILDNIDVVIFATGYEISLPILKDHWVFDGSSDLQLYKSVFPIGLDEPDRMACIGILAPFSAVWPGVELQSRWATRVFNQSAKLPTKEQMRADCETKPKHGKRYIPVNPYSYQDEIAEQIGVKPSFWRQMFYDPRLAMACQYGPQLPYTYRLQGPGAWSGARDAILNAWENTTSSTRRSCRTHEEK